MWHLKILVDKTRLMFGGFADVASFPGSPPARRRHRRRVGGEPGNKAIADVFQTKVMTMPGI